MLLICLICVVSFFSKIILTFSIVDTDVDDRPLSFCVKLQIIWMQYLYWHIVLLEDFYFIIKTAQIQILLFCSVIARNPDKLKVYKHQMTIKCFMSPQISTLEAILKNDTVFKDFVIRIPLKLFNNIVFNA